VTKPPAPPPGPKIISNLPVSAQGYVWPVDGRVMVRFGETLPGEPPTRSRGIDIVVGSGAEIRAARAGTAYVTLSSLPQFGNTIAIDHGNGVTTFYGYELVVQVQNGQQVQQGQVIALAASRASPRVHFRIRRDGGPVDPLPYLPAER
jgi:murein DD-endopeptidase MepM/ murein hydrolase activator NlpD